VIVVGIDPGLKGGVAAVGGDEPMALPMPISGGEVDGGELARLLRKLQPGLIVIEKVHSMPGQGVRSMFAFGYGLGIVVGVAEGLTIPVRWVTPQAWKKLILAGTAKDKNSAITFARQAYPEVNLVPGKARTPKDGLAEALCIAEYGGRVYGF
jgi:crossover junction endodeoxyribonuclease RuvC